MAESKPGNDQTVFASTMSANGISFESKDELYQRLTLGVPTKSAMMEESQQGLNEIAKRKKIRDEQNIVRTRRRNKFMKHCALRQENFYEFTSLNEVENRLIRPSQLENKFKNSQSYVASFKKVVQANRLRFEQEYKRRQESDSLKKIDRDNNIYKNMKAEFKEDVDHQQVKYADSIVSDKYAVHAQRYQDCLNIVHDLLDVTDKAAAIREVSDNFFFFTVF